MAAESNFFNDPEAAKIVLECGAPVVVIPLDATKSVSLSREDAASVGGFRHESRKICSGPCPAPD